MKKFILMSLPFLLLAACATTNPQSSSTQTSVSSEALAMYKESFYGGEIPNTWSQVSLGDVVPMPYTENTWIDHQYIIFSFGKDNVAFGDTNWTQADFAIMNTGDMSRWVAFLKNSDVFNQSVQQWTQETIDGKTADVATFKTEPDGTVSKGGTGGKMYFISNATNGMGLVIAKQALGDEEFESGFKHYIETIHFDPAQ
jgi:hypothetical protein